MMFPNFYKTFLAGKLLVEEEEYLGVNGIILITGIISLNALNNFNSVMTTFCI